MTADHPVRQVLDATAIITYAQGAVAVGELICELDGQERFAVPDACLLEAAAQLDADGWHLLDLLLANARCVRVGAPEEWRDVAALARDLGSVQRAVALWWADACGAWVLSREPAAYGEDAESVIEV